MTVDFTHAGIQCRYGAACTTRRTALAGGQGARPRGRMRPAAGAEPECALRQSFAPLMGVTLSIWVWWVILEGMGRHVEWWTAVLPACALLGSAFGLDAASTARFGRRWIAACESSPLMRVVAGRYGLLPGVAVQAAAVACLLAVQPLLFGPLSHHALLGSMVVLSAAHLACSASNDRYWRQAG